MRTPRIDRASPTDPLNISSDTMGVTSTSCLAEGTTPTTCQPKLDAKTAYEVDTIKKMDAGVLPVASGLNPVDIGPTVETKVDAEPSPPARRAQVVKAVMEAACKLAMQSHCPGVCEAATLVSILVEMVSDDQANVAEVESRLKRCRLVVITLERASLVLGKVRLSDCGDETLSTSAHITIQMK